MLVNGKEQFLCGQLPNGIFTHGCKNCQGTNVNVLLLATIDREKYPIKCTPYPCMSKAGSKGMAIAILIFVKSYILGPHSHTSKGLAICMHTTTL